MMPPVPSVALVAALAVIPAPVPPAPIEALAVPDVLWKSRDSRSRSSVEAAGLVRVGFAP